MNTADQFTIQKILSLAETYHATVLHLSVGNPPMIRVNEQLVALPEQNVLTPSFVQEVVISWLDPAEQERLQREKQITVAKSLENKKRFKIAVFYQQGHLSAALTLIPLAPPPLNALGLPAAAQQLATVSAGLVLVIGTANAEQSTTLASFVDYLNQTAAKHIVTIEQPVEFLFNDQRCVIEQREVGKDVASVESALQFVAQEDVDVVMLSALDSPQAYTAALSLAAAGKTVFVPAIASAIVGVLSDIIYRFTDIEQQQIRMMLAHTLVGVINQRRVNTVSGDRAMIAEVMIPNESIRTIIQKGDLLQLNNILYTSREPGIRSLDIALAEAVSRGIVSRDVAMHFAQNPALFR
ncbi:MAG: hypothetical protein HYV32_06630 [Candidatus Kerfeldbacteria bacterium]|nr:hypothetical protein [Candidatus Kerfeldbacteria bacterium]